jgi:hypothetical protein
LASIGKKVRAIEINKNLWTDKKTIHTGKSCALTIVARPQASSYTTQTALLYSLCVRPDFSHKELNLKELALLDDGGKGGHLLEDGLPVLGVATAA